MVSLFNTYDITKNVKETIIIGERNILFMLLLKQTRDKIVISIWYCFSLLVTLNTTRWKWWENIMQKKRTRMGVFVVDDNKLLISIAVGMYIIMQPLLCWHDVDENWENNFSLHEISSLYSYIWIHFKAKFKDTSWT